MGSILIQNHTSQLTEGEKVRYGVPLKKTRNPTSAIPRNASSQPPRDTGPFSFPAYGMRTPDPRGKLFRDWNYLIPAPLLLPFYIFDDFFIDVNRFSRVTNL